MRQLYLIIIWVFVSQISNGQTNNHLIGRWELQNSLQTNRTPCNFPKVKSTLIFLSNNTYSWIFDDEIISGKWKCDSNTINLYRNKNRNTKINRKVIVNDLLYSIEWKNGLLIIFEPGDTPCPYECYKKIK